MSDRMADDLKHYASRPTPLHYNDFFKAAELAIKNKIPPDELVSEFSCESSQSEDYVWLLMQEFQTRHPDLHDKLLGKKAPPKPKIFTDDYIVIDFETGGFQGTDGFRPVEYGALLYLGGKLMVRSGLVNPYLDDDKFAFPLSLEEMLHITDSDIRSRGIHPKECVQTLASLLTHKKYVHLPVWGHNLVKFDYPLYQQEARRYDGPMVEEERLRDSAALYKALKMSSVCNDRNLLAFMRQTLNARRKGLKFSISHILTNEDLPMEMEIVDGELVNWVPNPEIGITEEIYEQMKAEGLHRAGMDCVVTHVLIQWLKQHGEHMWME